MREVLFRGFTPDENGKDKAFVNGEWIKGQWVQGSYLKLNKTTYCFKEDYERDPGNTEHYIVFDQMTDWGLPNRHLKADVIPETIGQFIGLTDKNGKKIFEGDIVDVLYDANYAGVAAERIGKFEVVFDRGCFMKRKKDGFGLFHFIASDVHTVIGNIHDNPELLKGEEENA